MHLHAITAAGLAAATTVNGLLLPPEISASDAEIVNTLPFEVANTAQSSILKLDCPGCPVPVRGNKMYDDTASLEVKTDIPSHLGLAFDISSDSDVDHLTLNGFELYPNADPFHQTLTAPLIPNDLEGQTNPSHAIPTQQLGFGLHVQDLAKSKEDLLELIQLELQIIEVGNVFIDGIENIQIKMVKTVDGKLMIGEVSTTASQTIMKTPMDKQEECTTLLCKWRAMLTTQLARLRSQKHCAGRKGRPNHPHVQVDADGTHRLPGHRRPHGVGKGHHGHHGHEHHVHKHSWGQLFKNIASHILLPVAIGIVAGVSVSILGMMVGTFIVCLWRTFFRPAGRRHHHRRRAGSYHKAGHHETAVDEEKSGLMAYQEEEAPPAYIEEGAITSDEKKPENEA